MVKSTQPIDDAPVTGQKFFLINMASPSSERQKSPSNIFKVKFVCETLDEAKRMAERFREDDPDFDTYVGPIGKWIPFLDNPLLVENVEYQEHALQELISEHRKIQKQTNNQFLQRVDRETQKIMDHAKRQGSEEDNKSQDDLVKKAVTLRYKIYQLDTKIESFTQERSKFQTEFDTFDDAIKQYAEQVDLPKIDDVVVKTVDEIAGPSDPSGSSSSSN